ncbi:DUF7534 family protein [Halobaculum lipolyticum]|uniref:Integral membrane protein n=1 Tax=Halobaculum lipolyticum TaxID=3032001 RepID=A0ABD5W4F9_9EURY|nr:hypothetical protein [Halobaculum sp. DT31]
MFALRSQISRSTGRSVPRSLAPIQSAVPGFSALAAVGLVFVAVTALAVAYAVARDADARGSSVPTVWGVGSVAVWPVSLWYLLVYARRRQRTRPRDRGERAAATVALAGATAFVLAATAAPPDPVTQLVWAGALGPSLLVPGYVLVYRRGWRRIHGRR